MVSNVSIIFETDLKDFIDILESMEIHLTNSLKRIESRLYTEEEIYNILKYIQRQTNTLTFILISMIKKASQYRPTNIALQDLLRHLGSYISYITSLSVNALSKYRKNPIYGIRSVNRALRDIIHYIKAIKMDLYAAIGKGLFL